MKYYNKNTIPIKETPTQLEILQYLNLFEKGIACKIELSGAPIRKGGKVVGIRKFKNDYFRTGISDIMFVKDGMTYFFEVKTPRKASEISNRYYNGKWDQYINLKSNERLKNQYEFLMAITSQGLRGGFVCCVEDVLKIIYDDSHKGFVYFPKLTLA